MKGFRPVHRFLPATVGCGAIVFLTILSANCFAETGKTRLVDFGRDIRPILSDRCFKCHGPDAAKRQADLRLDLRPASLEPGDSGETPLVPGDSEASAVWQRIATDDDDLRMPPAGEGKPLTAEEISLFKRWIDEGANYAPHWSFVAPKRPEPPSVELNEWPRGDLDRFVLKRLEAEGRRPSPQADRRTLIRRLHLDLIGIPPAPKDVEDFVNDRAADAYDRLVDRLLSSSHYGERMAQDWLDLARYSDTTGYAADSPRSMWLYRDWVIKALNKNMPFDQFTIEQLAGDMLPEATVEQRIATGFHRNSMQALGNNPRKEEFRVKGIVDRVNTTGRVWLGLTVSCAECHDHKYDPISQQEYYRLFAIFNNIPHYGKNFGVRGPRLDAVSPLAGQRRRQIENELAELKQQINPFTHQALAHRLQDWEKRVRPLLVAPQESTEAAPLIAYWPLGDTLADRSAAPAATALRAAGQDQPAPTWADDSDSPSGRAIELGKQQYLRVANQDKLVPSGDMTISAWLKTNSGKADIVCKWDSVRGQRSFVFGIGGEGEQNATPGHLYAWVSGKKEYFSGQQIYGSIPVHDDQWHHVALVFRAGDRVDLYVDGERDVNTRLAGQAPARLANSSCDLILGAGYSLKPEPSSYFLTGSLSDVRIYAAAVEPVATLGNIPGPIRAILAIAPIERSAEQNRQLGAFFGRLIPGEMSAAVRDRMAKLRQEFEFLGRPHQAQVMLEMEQPRTTHVHTRGNYLSPGEAVSPGVPAFLPADSLPESGDSLDRLSFAQWLVQRDNPLTARVAVNRFWQHYFGTGLVRTADDFGLQGEWPSHPDLLDWLAVEFMESSWDMKALHRMIVMSATYRQSSASSAEAYRLDPANRLLGRGPRRRLPAEQIRDQALSIAGLLSPKLGGPSVYPKQPTGLFEEKGLTMYHPAWITSANPERYRRGVYVYWKRMNLYPSMAIFDAPTRERCRVQRAATNTPLQALVLLNDPVFIEAARSFGTMILGKADNDKKRIDFAVQRCLARPATEREIERYRAFVARQREHYRQHPEDARQLVSGAGDQRADEVSSVGVAPSNTDLAERAAWTTLASVLLNLDETITTP